MAYFMDVEKMLNICSEPFVLLKRDHDDYSYDIGGDIDIMARNAEQLVREILHLSYGLVTDTLSIRLQKHEEHHHIDFIEDDKIVVRIDIIDNMEDFKKLLMDGNKYAHLAFRLMEYAKYPQKKKHLNYVKKCII